MTQQKSPQLIAATHLRALANDLREDLGVAVEVLRDDVSDGLDSVADSLEYDHRANQRGRLNVVELRPPTAPEPPAPHSPEALTADLARLRILSRRVGRSAATLAARINETLALLPMLVADEVITEAAATEIARSLRDDPTANGAG